MKYLQENQRNWATHAQLFLPATLQVYLG